MPTPDPRRRILVLSTGLSPQVVTETLWSLAIARTPSWTPDEVVLITTKEGARRAEQSLLAQGRLAALGADYRRGDLAALAGALRIEVIADADRPGFEDVDSDAAHLAAADRTMAIVRDLTAEGDRRIHASIAGGRKSQGALLALSMSLFARPGDRLSHVIVDDAFAGHPDFFYPPPVPTRLTGRDGAPLDTAGARVRLAEIPFPRLRARLPREIFEADHFAEAVLDAQRALDPLTLAVDPLAGGAWLNGQALRLTPVMFAWLAALAWDRRGGGSGLLRRDPDRAAIGRWRSAGAPVPRDLGPEHLEEWASRLNKLARHSNPGLIDVKLVASMGRRPNTRYRLTVAPENIDWLGA
ncbi:MAG: CRISPR-associated ring nuclease Csm6 [Caulobacteraceae bacterium]